MVFKQTNTTTVAMGTRRDTIEYLYHYGEKGGEGASWGGEDEKAGEGECSFFSVPDLIMEC